MIGTDKTPKIWLSKEETEKILDVAKKESYRDYLIFALCRYGLRIGEIVGYKTLPGIHGEDLRENGIWLVGKGYSHQGEAPSLYPLPSEFATVLKDFSVREGRGKGAKLFDVSVRQMERRIKVYAEKASVADWISVRPHRLRAFFRDGPEREGHRSLHNPGRDATQERDHDKFVRWKDKLVKAATDHGKPRVSLPRISKFWYAGLGVSLLIYHSYGILTGVYSGLEIVPYDFAILFGVLEAIIALFLGPWFLWQLFLWTHDHQSNTPKHVFDDPRILA